MGQQIRSERNRRKLQSEELFDILMKPRDVVDSGQNKAASKDRKLKGREA